MTRSAQYKYLNKYSKLPPVSQKEAREKSNLDLNPDVQTDARSGLHTYLDDFLSAIRVFGYLERDVFNELARHLQTRRLMAGDTCVCLARYGTRLMGSTASP